MEIKIPSGAGTTPRVVFKIYAHPQEVGFPLDIAASFFNNFILRVRELLISEWVQVPLRLPTETNNQRNQGLILFRNAATEAEKKIRTIKAEVQPVGGSLHQRTFMSIPGGSPSIQTADLTSRFQDETGTPW